MNTPIIVEIELVRFSSSKSGDEPNRLKEHVDGMRSEVHFDLPAGSQSGSS